jgi:nucleotide-binding universal stress UspA family protein
VSSPTPTAPADRDPAAAPAGARPDSEDPPARDVVVGVDGSEIGLSAVRWAAREAAARGAPLRIIHAADYLGEPQSPGSPPPELPHARRITATAYTAARHAAPGLRTSTEVVPGDATTALLRAAAAGQLLVLGISTTGAADEMVLAPVAARVAARSPQPVVIVPRSRPAPDARPVVAVLGLGDPTDDEAVAAFAREAARRSGHPLSVLQTRAGAEDALGEPFQGLDVDREELPRARGTQLLAEACPTPLLVLSTGRGGRFHRGLDGLHRWLLRHCTSPMALVPAAARPAGSVAPEATTGS